MPSLNGMSDSLERLKSDVALQEYISRASAKNDSLLYGSVDTTIVAEESPPEESVSLSKSEQRRNSFASHLQVPLKSLERHEPIACHATGRRSSCAGDEEIRIYLKFPMSGDRIF